MIILRPYQQILIDKTRESLLAGHRAPLLVAPCGSGKTVMFCYFASRTMQKSKRILILAHRSELLDQIGETLQAFNVSHSYIAPGRWFDKRSPVHVGSVFSVVRRLHKMNPPDLIIIDEAHHSIKKSTWGRILDYFPKAYRIGVTATPTRLSGESLNDMFDDLIVGPSVDDLIKLGNLSPYKCYVPARISTIGLHMRGGDFAKDELSALVDRPSITGDAVNEYRKFADGKRAIAFCVSVEHAKHVAAKFNASGYIAMCIDGSLATEIRRGIINEFKQGKIQILTSCDLISEGFDLPAIECAIMLRPTASLALWIQQSGRALRPYEKKEYAILLDHCGNALRHGLPDEERTWSLEGVSAGRQAGSGSPGVKVCERCFAAMFSGATVCKFCGYTFEIASREVEQKAGELEEVDPALVRLQRNREQFAAADLGALITLGRKRGYRRPEAWANYVMRAREAKKMAMGGRHAE